MNEFRRIHRKVFEGVKTSKIPTKYKKFSTKRARHFKHLFDVLLQHDKLTGIDFGCGVGTGVVIGKIMGLQITGLDLPNSIYQPIHTKLKGMDYDIVLRDTLEFPWTEFDDDQFDFIVAMWSFGRGIKNNEQRQMRIKELARIAKPGAIWILEPKRHATKMSINPTFLELADRKNYDLLGQSIQH